MNELEKAAEKYVNERNYSDNNNGYSPGEVGFECEASFKEDAQWQSKQSPWISVEEQLPETDGMRVWVKSDLLNYQPLTYHKGKFYARLSDGAYDGSVTHWMEIKGI